MGNCPGAPGTAQANAEPISGSFTFQRILQITSWVLFGLSVLLWLGLIIPHLRRYKAPNEQRQIFRIILTPLVFSLASVVSLHTYSAAPYISPIANLYEAFALASLFLLYVQIVAPEIHSREEFFRAVENKRQSGEVIPGGLLRFFIVRLNPSHGCFADSNRHATENLADRFSLCSHLHYSHHHSRNHPSYGRLLRNVYQAEIRSYMGIHSPSSHYFRRTDTHYQQSSKCSSSSLPSGPSLLWLDFSANSGTTSLAASR